MNQLIFSFPDGSIIFSIPWQKTKRYERFLFERLLDGVGSEQGILWNISFQGVGEKIELSLSIQQGRFYFSSNRQDIWEAFWTTLEDSYRESSARDLIETMRRKYGSGEFRDESNRIKSQREVARQLAEREERERIKAEMRMWQVRAESAQRILDDADDSKIFEKGNTMGSNDGNGGDKDRQPPFGDPEDDNPKKRKESIRNAISILTELLSGDGNGEVPYVNEVPSSDDMSGMLNRLLDEWNDLVVFQILRNVSIASAAICRSFIKILKGQGIYLELYPTTLDLLWKSNSHGNFSVILESVVSDFQKVFSNAIRMSTRLRGLHASTRDVPLSSNELRRMIPNIPRMRLSELLEIYSLFVLSAKYSSSWLYRVSLSLESPNWPKTSIFRSFRIDCRFDNEPILTGIRKFWIKHQEGNEMDMLLISEFEIVILDSKLKIDMDVSNTPSSYVYQAVRYGYNLGTLLHNHITNVIETNIRNEILMRYPLTRYPKIFSKLLRDGDLTSANFNLYAPYVDTCVKNVLAVGNISMLIAWNDKFDLWQSTIYPKLELYNFFSEKIQPEKIIRTRAIECRSIFHIIKYYFPRLRKNYIFPLSQ